MFANNKRQILENSFLELKNISKYQLQIGCELEFYIIGDYKEDFIINLKNNLLNNFNIISDLKREEGQGQFELTTKPISNLLYLADNLHLIKKISLTFAQKIVLMSVFQLGQK